MYRYIFVPLILIAPMIDPVAASSIRLSQAQSEKANIQTIPLNELVAEGGLSLPAQVIVPPAQVEVIAASAASLVAGVRVAYGDLVRKGQPLLSLQGGALLELQRDFSSARAQAGLATENRRRDEALFTDGIISQSRLSSARAVEIQAQALVGEKRQTLRMSGLADPGSDTERPGIAELRAPFDGVVLEVMAQPGQRVDATTPLLKVARITPLWLEIQASTVQAARMASGDQVQIPGCTVMGVIRLISPQMQSASQSQLVRAEIAKPDGCVKPFQFVHVMVTPRTVKVNDHWRLPASAVARHQGQAWVFVVTESGFLPVEVKVFDETIDKVTVTGNVNRQSRVVTKGISTLKAVWLGLGSPSVN